MPHSVSDSQKAKAIGLFQSVNTLSMMIGPVVGGYLAQTMGYATHFYIISVILFGSFLAAVMLPKKDDAQQGKISANRPTTVGKT